MAHWRRHLAVIWLSQFLSIAGFNFAMPFAPYYIQALGVTDPAALRMWISLFAAATPLSLAVFSPVWGALADRYGRRLMLLRANFAGAVVVALMGAVGSVEALVGLRLLQGVFTGTMTAAQTMISVAVPVGQAGMALGTLSAAVFSGGMAGALVGGILADAIGYRASFAAGSVLLLAAGLLVLFGTEERAAPKEPPGGETPGNDAAEYALPILIMMAAIAFVRQFDSPFLPLLVQEIHGGLKGVSVWSGSLVAVGGVAGLLAGPLLGRLADRVPPPRIGQGAAVAAAALMIPQALAHGFLVLFAARFGTIFCSGGLEPVFLIWLSKVTPARRRGFVFGWAATARSVGWILSPLVGGLVAARLGVRPIFYVGAGLYLLLGPLIALVVRRVKEEG